MSWFRGVLSCVPVIGPAADAVDSAIQGDHVGAAAELCSFALDVCSMSQLGSATVMWRTAAPTNLLLQHSFVHGVALHNLIGGAGRVIKSALKKKVTKRARRVVIKVGFAAAIALTQKGRARFQQRTDSWKQHINAMSRLFTNTGVKSPVQYFETNSSREAQLHAVLARQMYLPTASRRGVAAFFDVESDNSSQDVYLHGLPAGRRCWYAYVGGNDYRGFWYSPETLHLILAERGTAVADREDLLRDACLAMGSGLAAVSSRAKASMSELREQLMFHDAARVTVTGHSLGGAVAVFLASSAGGSCFGKRKQLIDAVHVFNAGGLPDLTRSLSLSLTKAEVYAHHIQGDLVSVGFLPCLQRCYVRQEGLAAIDPHAMIHFQPSWALEHSSVVPGRPPSLLEVSPKISTREDESAD